MTEPPTRVVRWHEAAIRDVEEITAYIKRDAPQAAEALARAFVDRAESLAAQPFLGGECPYAPNARTLIEGKYLIYYTVARREVVIRAVVHGARRFRPSWLRRRE